MKDNNKNLTEEQIKKLGEEYLEKEREREMILMEADKIKEQTFDFDTDGEIELKSEIEDMLMEKIDDPEAKYDLYYNVINRLLKNHLPKGEYFKEARDLIYEEKNTFMTRGHRIDNRGIRGADGRMSYIEEMHEMVNIISEWISTKGTTYSLYTRMRDLNVAKGYGTAFDRKK